MRKLHIHKEGKKILAVTFLALLAIDLLVMLFITDVAVIKWIVLSLSIVLFLFVVFFFRLPERSVSPESEIIYAPADGKVVVIEETEETEYFKDVRLQVSIFMSPFNMHSNKYPVSGKVKYVNYHPGNKMVAWHPKSSQLNEHCSTVVETADGVEILVRQIAGAVARRIVTYSEVGADVVQGDELGFIKFGSRVDVFLPEGIELKVDMFDKVRANKTILAVINKES